MIKNIKLSNFRLFDKLNLNIDNPYVIFSGRNAIGKTSILESIFITSTTKSNRTNDILDVVKFNSLFSSIEIEDELNDYKVVISKEGKYFYKNGDEIKRFSDYIGTLNCLFIGPADIEIVDGQAASRRKFLDLNISMFDKKYFNELLRYKKILNERNKVLKDNNPDLIMVNVLTTELIKSLEYIAKLRIGLINDLNFYLKNISSLMDIEKISLEYEPTYNLNNIKSSFDTRLNSDLFYKATQIGTHRDTFKILFNGIDAKSYASHGQLRIIYIAIKLALKEIIAKKKGEPILLLDDIFQALDNKKIMAITRYVKSAKQVFITTTSVLGIPDDILKESIVIRLEGEMEQNGK